MRSSISQKLARQLGAIALILCFLLSGVTPALADSNADPGHLPHGPQAGLPDQGPPITAPQKSPEAQKDSAEFKEAWQRIKKDPNAHGMLAQTPPSGPMSGPNSPPSGEKLITLREGIKSGQIKMKVQGDGETTTEVGLQLTNTTDKPTPPGVPIKVVIPANEVLRPNILSVQTMVVTQDVVVEIQPGQIALPRIKCFCGSPKTIAPPPQARDGLDFDAGDYKDPATWSKLAAIIAAGQELATMGAFEKLFWPSDDQINKDVEDQIKKEVEDRITVYRSQHLTASHDEADAIVRGDMASIKIKAGQTVNQRAKQHQVSRITQLAIWRLLGLQSGNPEDAVTPDKMTSDFFKQFGLKAKSDPGLLTTYGGKFDKKGKYIPDESKRLAIEKNNTAIFDVVDLTVRRSSAPGLTGIATLPNDDPIDTFCSVGERAFNQGDYPEAKELLHSAVKTAEAKGETDPRLSRSLNSLGMVYIDQEKWPLAQQCLERAVDLRKKIYGADSKEVAEVDNNLGLLQLGQEHWDKAGPMFDEAVNIFEKTIGKTSSPVGNSLNYRGKNLCMDKKPDDGAGDLSRALTVAMLNCPQDVKGNMLYTPFVAEVETNLADAYCQEGKYEDAGGLYQKALKTDINALGKEHPFLFRIYDGLANVAAKTGQAAKSDDYKQTSTGLKELTLGKGSKELTESPLSTTAYLGRQWNYWQGRKDLESGVASVRAGITQAMAAAVTVDSSRMNRPVKDKWALVIGISKFKDPTISLQYAAKDAADVAGYLTREANFAPDHVRLLTNEKATKTEIMSQLGDNWLPRVAGRDDLVFIFFSSHGSPSSMDGENVNYLVAYDTDKTKLYATGLPLQDFADAIKKRVHSDRVVLVMDACHSGAALGAKGMYRDQNLDANQIAQGTGQLVICSSAANESSWESTRYRNGVFTHYLLEGMRKHDNLNKLSDVFNVILEGVPKEVQFDRNGATQTPKLQTQWVGNELIIGVKPTAPGPGTKDGDPNAQSVVVGAKEVTAPAAASGKGTAPVAAGKGPANGVHKAATVTGQSAKSSTSSNQTPGKGKPQVR